MTSIDLNWHPVQPHQRLTVAKLKKKRKGRKGYQCPDCKEWHSTAERADAHDYDWLGWCALTKPIRERKRAFEMRQAIAASGVAVDAGVAAATGDTTTVEEKEKTTDESSDEACLTLADLQRQKIPAPAPPFEEMAADTLRVVQTLAEVKTKKRAHDDDESEAEKRPRTAINIPLSVVAAAQHVTAEKEPADLSKETPERLIAELEQRLPTMFQHEYSREEFAGTLQQLKDRLHHDEPAPPPLDSPDGHPTLDRVAALIANKPQFTTLAQAAQDYVTWRNALYDLNTEQALFKARVAKVYQPMFDAHNIWRRQSSGVTDLILQYDRCKARIIEITGITVANEE